MCQSKANQFVFFFSWHCLCLPCSHAPTMQHRRDKNYPPTLHTAPQAQCNAPGECWVLIKRQSQGSLQLLLQCLPTALLDLYRQLSLLITCIRPVTLLKPCFVRGCSACQLAFSFKKQPCMHLQEDGEARRKVRMTLLMLQNVQQQRCIEPNPKTVEVLRLAVLYSSKLSFQSRLD